MDLNEVAVKDRLQKILMQRFNINLGTQWQDIQDEHLLGSKIRMAPRDLLYLHSDIEKEFNIKIPEKHIVDGKFSSINNIVQIVCDEL